MAQRRLQLHTIARSRLVPVFKLPPACAATTSGAKRSATIPPLPAQKATPPAESRRWKRGRTPRRTPGQTRDCAAPGRNRRPSGLRRTIRKRRVGSWAVLKVRRQLYGFGPTPIFHGPRLGLWNRRVAAGGLSRAGAAGIARFRQPARADSG